MTKLAGYNLKMIVSLIAIGALAACTVQPTPGTASSATALPPAPAGESTEATPAIPANEIRPPDVAGQFYPADPDELATMVDAFLAAATSEPGTPIALVAPHAGYVYSGPVAAYSFRQLEGRDIRVAVIIASDHQAPVAAPIAVWTTGGWRTPLGVVAVDAELAQALVDADPRITADKADFAGEHPIEVELPLLQRACPQCRVVPVLITSDDPADIEALANALIQALPGRRAVIIASSDLSHYPSYEDAQQVDGATLDAMASFDPEALRTAVRQHMAQGVPNLVTCACGEAAILAAMEAARGLGADTASVLDYANSGDTSLGNQSQVVGYGAVMFWRAQSSELNAEQRAFLLTLARETIAARLAGDPLPTPAVDDPALLRPSGAFVTLEIGGELRGCIGNLSADTPLYVTIQQMALAAAFEDPRFPALGADKLPSVAIEISILSPMQPISSTDEIQIGRDGLLIVKGKNRGVFLPQVPVEQGWDRDQYLERLCEKAWLPQGCWRQDAILYTFTAEVFGEAK
jgi:hypothetical protein